MPKMKKYHHEVLNSTHAAIRPSTLGPNQEELKNKMDAVQQQFISAIQKNILDSIEKRIRMAELKAQVSIAGLAEKLDVIHANQNVLQGLLGKKELYTVEEFHAAFKDFVINRIGIVEDGHMKGNIFIDTFNLGCVPPPTHIDDSIYGKKPLFIS